MHDDSLLGCLSASQADYVPPKLAERLPSWLSASQADWMPSRLTQCLLSWLSASQAAWLPHKLSSPASKSTDTIWYTEYIYCSAVFCVIFFFLLLLNIPKTTFCFRAITMTFQVTVQAKNFGTMSTFIYINFSSRLQIYMLNTVLYWTHYI